MKEALINPEILKWAIKRSGISNEALAKKMGIKNIKKIEKWKNGELKPTFIQAQKIAKILHIPFGYLYLKSIPKEKLSIPDLRTLKNTKKDNLNPDILELIDNIKLKQDWYKDYLIEQGAEPLPFVNKFNITTNYKVIANDITKVLKLTLEDRKQANNWENFLRLLMDRCEDSGIWVMRSGIVGNNTHRGLSVSDFRGLAICDEIAPIVFINGKDAKAAQIFTLVHELAHIWIGESGISDLSLENNENFHNKIEKLCNKVAAEVLVPENILQKKWNSLKNIDTVSKFFKVSNVVVARRAYELNFISWEEYKNFYISQQELWKMLEEKQKKSSGGQPQYTIPIRYGKNFTNAILIASLSGQIMLRDAGRLIGLAPPKLLKLAQEVGIR